MSTNIHQNPTPPILTAYSFNNNPTMLSSYQSTPYYKTSSLMATPQFQPPSPFYTNPPSQQTLDNVTSSFGLGNHIESIPMANSIFRSQVVEEEEEVQHLLLDQPITLITNMNFVNGNNGNGYSNNNTSREGSKLSSFPSSLQNTKNRQQIMQANYNYNHNHNYNPQNYIPMDRNNTNNILQNNNNNNNNINNVTNNHLNNNITNNNPYNNPNNRRPYDQPENNLIHQQYQQQQIQYINLNSNHHQYQNPYHHSHINNHINSQIHNQLRTSTSNPNPTPVPKIIPNQSRNINIPLLQKMKQRQQQQQEQKQYKQIEKRLSDNIRILSHRSRSKNRSDRSEISKQSRRQSSNSNTSYNNYHNRSRSQNKNIKGNKNVHNENQEKVKVLSKIVQKLKNQQKTVNNVHILSHDRSRNRTTTSNTHLPKKQQPEHHRNNTNANLQSKKIQDLLKDIKQLNKQNCKAIYTIKRTTAKDTTPDHNHKNLQQQLDSFSATPPLISHMPPTQTVHYNKDGPCPTCGCTCKMKKKAKGEVQQINNITTHNIYNQNQNHNHQVLTHTHTHNYSHSQSHEQQINNANKIRYL